MSLADALTIDVENRPRTGFGVAVLSLLGVLWVVAVRISLGGLIGDPVHPVTYVGKGHNRWATPEPAHRPRSNDVGRSGDGATRSPTVGRRSS